MYNVKWLEHNDYNILCEWWKDWRWTPPPRELLPDNAKCGIIVSKDDVDICAGFIYLTNSKFAIIEYIVSNFKVKDKEIRKEALTFLINALDNIAKREGYIATFTSLKNPSLKNIYLECGYQVGSENTVELIKKIQ